MKQWPGNFDKVKQEVKESIIAMKRDASLKKVREIKRMSLTEDSFGSNLMVGTKESIKKSLITID